MNNLSNLCRLEQSGIFTIRQAAVLLMLKDGKKRTRELSEGFKIPRASISRTVDALCIMGFVKSVRDDNDRRDVWAYLTDKGKELVHELV